MTAPRQKSKPRHGANYNHLAVKQAVKEYCALLLLPYSRKSRSPEARFVLKRLLHELIWKLSEAAPTKRAGKYVRCELWSKSAYTSYRAALIRKDRSPTKGLVLEHVVPRRVIVERLIAARTVRAIEAALNAVITCVVHKDEDAHLRRREREQRKHREHSTPDSYFTAALWWRRYADIPWEKFHVLAKIDRSDDEAAVTIDLVVQLH
jgi:hypothetical protein